MDQQAVFVATCLIAAVGSIAMGLVANLPIALAPAMGLNAFFAFVVVGGMHLTWQTGMATIFWGAVGFFYPDRATGAVLADCQHSPWFACRHRCGHRLDDCADGLA